MKLSSIYNLPITLQQTSSSNPFSLNIVYVYTNILMKKRKKDHVIFSIDPNILFTGHESRGLELDSHQLFSQVSQFISLSSFSYSSLAFFVDSIEYRYLRIPYDDILWYDVCCKQRRIHAYEEDRWKKETSYINNYKILYSKRNCRVRQHVIPWRKSKLIRKMQWIAMI